MDWNGIAPDERREAIQELRAEGMTQREIADVIGIDKRTVGRELGANAPENELLDNEKAEEFGANAPAHI
jgi:IS30 family transposase